MVEKGYLESGVGLVLGRTVGSLDLGLRGATLSEELLGLESSNTARAGTGDGLAVALVLDVTASEDTLDAGEAGTGLGNDITILVELELLLNQSVGGIVANSVEETVGINDFLLVVEDVLDTEVGHEAVGTGLTDDLGGDGVEADIALGVGEQTISHDLGSAELVLADEDGDAATVLGEEHGLLSGGVTTTDNVEGLVAEDGDSTIADSAGTDTVLPVGLLAGQVQAAGVGASSDDNGVGGASRGIIGAVTPLGPHLERALGQVDARDGLGDDLGTEALGLLAHSLHQLLATDTVGETGEVLDVGGGGELATGGGAVGEHTLIKDGIELSARKVNGGSVGTGAGADN